MSQPYSERFCDGTASVGGTVDSFTVPTNHRAIIRCVTYADASPTGTGAVGALILPGGVFAVIGSPLGPLSIERTELHIVVYEGETFSVFRASGALFWTVSGYLLEDP